LSLLRILDRSFGRWNSPQDDCIIVVVSEGKVLVLVVVLSGSEVPGVGFKRIKNKSFPLLRITDRLPRILRAMEQPSG